MRCEVCYDGRCVDSCEVDTYCSDGECVSVAWCETAEYCGPCQDCVDGFCVEICEYGEFCQHGECVSVLDCDPACGPCERCDQSNRIAPECVTMCQPDERCVDDVCTPAVCDPVCDSALCLLCDPLEEPPVCVSRCDEQQCEACDGEGACQTLCNREACQRCDGAGDCVWACDPDTERCVEGDCEPIPLVACDDESGFCDGAFVIALEIAPEPDPALGEPGCCCDLTGDGEIDNALAGLIGLLGPALGYDLDYFNRSIELEILWGALVILFEILGVDDLMNDDYVVFNIYLGDDPHETPDDNLQGLGDFLIRRESLDRHGNPLMGFPGATITDGWLEGGPSRFMVPLDLLGDGPPILFVVEGTHLRARIGAATPGFTLSDGEVCGYVTRGKLVAGLNDYVAESCGCLQLTSPLVTDTGMQIQCSTVNPADTTCDPTDPLGSVCLDLASSCGLFGTMLPLFFDVDLNGDGRGDALSLGVRFEAVQAGISGLVGGR